MNTEALAPAPITPALNLTIQQQELETDMTSQGALRFRSQIEKSIASKREDQTAYGHLFMNSLLDKVIEGIDDFIAEREAGKAGRKGEVYHCLKTFGDNATVAYLGLRMVLSGLRDIKTTAQGVAGRIGRALDDELTYRMVREEDATFYRKLKTEVLKRGAEHIRRKAAVHWMNRSDYDAEPTWSQREQILLGLFVVETIIVKTGLVEKLKVEQGAHKSAILLVPTKEAKKVIEERITAVEVMRPIYEPMIVPPMDWVGPRKGGYLTRNVRPLRLVKTHNREFLDSLEALDLSEVLEAVNAAQRTAWTINPYILTVLSLGWERDYSLGGIPSKYETPTPPKPHDIEENEEARKEWKASAVAVHMDNLEMGSKRNAFMSGLNIATRYSLFDRIYFPYQLDFRGRIYAAPALNPQGPDWMKALLHFADAKPLDEEAANFLAIHIANCGAFNKIDKAELHERVQWVYDNTDDIIACADNPFENRWWEEADSPYCFLAAAQEWAGWCREGEGFMSRIAVALDGSCSGIQHFSMAFADEIGGAAVNLVPSDKPADIYSLVMDKSRTQIERDAASTSDKRVGPKERSELVSDVATQWLHSGLISRSTFKRPTMTYGYGSNQFGFREQIFNDTLKPAHKAYKKGEGGWHFAGDGFTGSLYLSKVVQQGVEETVVKAAEAMAWLKKVAAVVTGPLNCPAEFDEHGNKKKPHGVPMRWTTPDGFLVVQDYKERKTHDIDTMMFGSRVRARMTEETPYVDRRKQASGLSPNFVHSLDATHLRLAVRQASREGIESFALVHDSFGTHAADTGRFFVVLRETLRDMYINRDVMTRFRDEVGGQLTDEALAELPDLPAMGNLDIEAVVESDFCFA